MVGLRFLRLFIPLFPLLGVKMTMRVLGLLGFSMGDALYLFYETKNAVTMQGDIGVSKSIDKGATWQQLGIALNEDWHLSYPYVFRHDGQIYMMPEGSQRGDLRLYRAVNFPLQWKLEKVIIKNPLIDSFIIDYDGKYWLFGSDLVVRVGKPDAVLVEKAKEEVEKRVRELMESERGRDIRKTSLKFKDMAKDALGEFGSSTKALSNLVQTWYDN